MRLLSFVSLFTFLFCPLIFAQQPSYFLKKHQPLPGQTVVIRASSDASQGAVTVIAGNSIQKGTLYVSLTTMLDKKMTMSGTVTTTTCQSGITSTIASPVTYIVTKTIR